MDVKVVRRDTGAFISIHLLPISLSLFSSPHPRSGCLRTPLPLPESLYGRACGRAYAPNFLGLMGLPKILTHGALLARFARRSSAIIKIICFSPADLTCFMVLMLDDFHNIHSKHTPDNLVKMNVVHMVSCLVDVHPTIRAVP